ncbi:MAG TPA: class II aldolase/adducin family protein [Anaerolineales bacterium]|nr:class II aldolase/adducin family protein [Anaerolineales bacterium]
MNEQKFEILNNLVEMTRSIGEPDKDLVILGDGNTSALISEQTFWVKASGAQMHNIDSYGFTEIFTERALNVLKYESLSDQELKQVFAEARVDPSSKHPSIETVFHALALSKCEAQFVAHTHPIAINSILCSQQVREALGGHLFSESALYLGPEAIIIDYADPGLPIARALIREIERYQQKWGQNPRIFYLLNHGMVALGQSTKEVENITAMAVKAARILLGTYALGGPHFISEADVQRVLTRPDEEFRRKLANQ